MRASVDGARTLLDDPADAGLTKDARRMTEVGIDADDAADEVAVAAAAGVAERERDLEAVPSCK